MIMRMNYSEMSEKLHIGIGALQTLEECIRALYPNDELAADHRFIRTLMVIESGDLTAQEAIEEARHELRLEQRLVEPVAWAAN